MNALTTITPHSTNAEIYRASTDAADLCRNIVVATAMEIQRRKYVRVEGWQAIAIAHGCTASARDVEVVDGGVRAIGEVRRMSDGALIAQAEGFVGQDEPTWFGGSKRSWKWGQQRGEKIWFDEVAPKRPDYAIRAMAQTRAISRACRSAFAHVVVLIDANLSTTPAEEVPDGGFDDGPIQDAQFAEAAQSAAGAATPANKIAAEDSAGVKAAKVGISLCKDKAALTKWKRNSATAVDSMSDGDFKAVSAAWSARLAEVEAPSPEPTAGHDVAAPAPVAEPTPFDDEIPF